MAMCNRYGAERVAVGGSFDRVCSFRRAARLFASFAVLCVAGFALVGCSGDTERGPTVIAPDLEVYFPFGHARYIADTISVTGRVEHAEMDKVRVFAEAGGAPVEGEIDADGTFRIADVPLVGTASVGLSVIARHSAGVSKRKVLRLSREPEITGVGDIALDAEGNRILLLDGSSAAILAQPLMDDDGADSAPRTIVSGLGVGDGPAFVEPSSMAIDLEKKRVFVVDAETLTLYAVDLEKGDRTIVSSSSDAEQGPPFSTPLEISIRPDTDPNDELDLTLVILADLAGVFEIEASTGNRRLVSTKASPGPSIQFYAGIGVDLTNQRYIATADEGAIFAVDPTTGARTMISDGASDPIARDFGKMTVRSNGEDVYIADLRSNGLVRIDLTSGDREQITSSGTPDVPVAGEGPPLSRPLSVVLDEENERFFLTDTEYADQLIEVDEDGNRTLVRNGGLGSGLHFSYPTGLKYDAAGDRLLAADFRADIAVSIDTATGDRTTILPPRGTTGEFILDVAVHPTTGVVYVVDRETSSLDSVDAATGTRTVVANLTYPSQVVIDAPSNTAYVLSSLGTVEAVELSSGTIQPVAGIASATAIALDATRRHLYADNYGQSQFVRIDLASGTPTTFTSPKSWSGPVQLAYDSKRERLIVIEEYADRLFAYSPATGAREVLSGATDTQTVRGNGPLLLEPSAVAVDATKQIAFVAEVAHSGIIAIDLVSGDRQLISK